MAANQNAATLSEALANPAVRSAILTNVQLAEALSATCSERVGVHTLGALLCMGAGVVNAVAMMKYLSFVSHVSGISTSVGLRAEGLQGGPALQSFQLLLSFTVGSFVAGLFIPKATLKLGQARYEVALLLVAVLVGLAWYWDSSPVPVPHDPENPISMHLLSAACGLQNAMASSWSGNILRNTHVTGTATDLGSAIGRIISKFLRLGCQIQKYTDTDWDEFKVDKGKVTIMGTLLASFILGGVLAAAVNTEGQELRTLLIPICLCIILAAAHVIFCMRMKTELQAEKAAEEKFTRQLSPAVNKAAEGKGSAQQGNVDERVGQFIRQISRQASTTKAKQ